MKNKLDKLIKNLLITNNNDEFKRLKIVSEIGDYDEITLEGISSLFITYFNDPEDSVKDLAIEQLVIILSENSSIVVDIAIKESLLLLFISILKLDPSERFRSTFLLKLSECVKRNRFMNLTKGFNHNRSKWIEKTFEVIINRYDHNDSIE